MKKAFKIAGITLLSLVAALVLIVLGYVIYVAAEYDRIEDNVQLTVDEGAAEIPYTEGVNYQTALDGFVVSDNVEVTKVRNIDTGYEFSDHNPVEMTFVLK